MRHGPERRHRLPRPVRRVAAWLAVLLVVEYLVLPQIAGSRKAIDTLVQVDPVYLLAGLGLEAAAIVAYASLTRSILPKGRAPSRLTLVRIQLATLSLSHCVPGGTVGGSSLGYRLMTGAGVDGTDAAFALATQGLGSALVLNAILWVALVISIPFDGFNPLYVTVAALGAVLIGAFALLVLSLTRGETRSADLLGRVADRLPLVDGAAVTRVVHGLARRLQELARDPRLLARAVGWAAANWLLDAASLWVFVAAFGYHVGPDGLLVAYGLANVLAALPITPGGIGVVEAVLPAALVAFGPPRAVAILGVVSWRLVNFWLPIPVGGLSYLSLRFTQRDDDAPLDAAPPRA